MIMDLPSRLADKIDVGDCWEWTASKTPRGYGQAKYQGQPWKAHRLVWTLLVGQIPAGLHIDHLCRNESCVNPDHLEPVEPGENARRGEVGSANRGKRECPRGHPYGGDNLHVTRSGARMCRACMRLSSRKFRAKLKHPALR